MILLFPYISLKVLLDDHGPPGSTANSPVTFLNRWLSHIYLTTHPPPSHIISVRRKCPRFYVIWKLELCSFRWILQGVSFSIPGVSAPIFFFRSVRAAVAANISFRGVSWAEFSTERAIWVFCDAAPG